jgi:hypothetical protein
MLNTSRPGGMRARRHWPQKSALAGRHLKRITCGPWSKLKAWERAEALPDYLRDTGAVLFIDDAHKLAGRKLQIARECALTAKIWIASASDEQRIPPNLRSVMMRRDPQVIRLGSDVAYDATNVLTWVLALVLLASGAWEASIVVAGLKALSGGRLAARQDA